MRAAERIGLCVVLFLVVPACDSKKSAVLLPDGSAMPDVGVDANQDTGRDVPGDTSTSDRAREASGDALTVDSAGFDSAKDAPVAGDLAGDLKSLDGGAEDVLNSLDSGAGEAGAGCVAGIACSGQTSCSTGDDIDIWCRSMLVCQSGTLRSATRFPTKCGATAGSLCPASQPSEGTACTVQSQVCSYPTGTCTCATGCEGGIDAGPCQRPKTWHCGSNIGIGGLPAGCPTQAPHLGQPCSAEKVICGYGGYCYQYQVTCQGGTWQPNAWAAFGGCA